MLSGLEVAKHNSRESCWVIVNGKAYDVTDFLDRHPGGPNIILRYGGKDATEEYEPFHPEGTIEKTLSIEKHLGPVDPATISTFAKPQVVRDLSATGAIPISLCMNLDDIELAAERVISRRAWTYIHSAADGLGSFRNNRDDWRKITFRPRILRNVAKADMSRVMLGQRSNLPFFIAPAAQARLVHQDGEFCLVRGAARAGIPYCTSSYTSVAHDELVACMKAEKETEAEGYLFFQLYVQKEKKKTIEMITMARQLGFKALLITVDTPVMGKREEDERYRAELDYVTGVENPSHFVIDTSGDDTPVLRGYQSYTLNWDDIRWIRQAWGADTGPIALKGIQTAEDALLAAEAGIDAIYLSNHGGRQCDDAPSSIRTLLEICRFYPEILKRTEIYLDGGVRRGADIVKALCLGAAGVGIGRPFMYSMVYGTEGVEKVIKLLSEEIETAMRLIGATSLNQLNPHYVNTRLLELELPPGLTPEESPVLRSKI